jgi:hypothetical protein
LIHAEEVHGAVLIGERDADVVAVDGIRPVSDAIRVDLVIISLGSIDGVNVAYFASEDAN